jgi:hypothetical protein
VLADLGRAHFDRGRRQQRPGLHKAIRAAVGKVCEALSLKREFELAINLKAAKALSVEIPFRCWPPPTRSSNESRVPEWIKTIQERLKLHPKIPRLTHVGLHHL